MKTFFSFMIQNFKGLLLAFQILLFAGCTSAVCAQQSKPLNQPIEKRPFWTEKSSYLQGDRVYFVGVASQAKTIEAGRKQALIAAQSELKSFLQIPKVEGLLFKTQMTFEEKTGSIYKVYRLMWATIEDIRAYQKRWLEQQKNQLQAARSKEESPRATLQRLGIPFTVREFRNRAWSGDLLALKLFIAAGMDINVAGWARETALSSAVRNNRLEAVEYLLNQGADPNIGRDPRVRVAFLGRDITGYTPLMLAVANKSQAITEALLRHCANPQNGDGQGLNAYGLKKELRLDWSLDLPQNCQSKS